LMSIVKYPIDAAEIDVPDDAQLPKGISNAKEWPIVIARAHGQMGLDGKEREVFLQHAFTEAQAHLRPVLQALILHHAAKDLDESQRASFLQATTGGDEELLALAQD